MKYNCEPRITSTCAGDDITTPAIPEPCDSWTACLPFGGSLISNGGCVNYIPGTPPPDGSYSKIVVVNGCIVSAELDDIPIYTAAPCAPVPTPCDCDGGGGGMPGPSPTIGNLFRYDASGLPLVKLSVQSGSGITVVGNGTVADPLVITNTMSQQARDSFKSGNNAIGLTGTGATNDPYTYTHKTAYQGKVSGMTFDAYGHLSDYTAPTEATTINGLVEGDGISIGVDVSTGIATVAIAPPLNVLTGKWLLGGYELDLYRNRIQNITQMLHVGPGDYRLGDYNATLNEQGSVVAIAFIPDDPSLVRVSASKRFPATTNNERGLSFSIMRNSSFRITYKAASVPADIQLAVNGTIITGDLMTGRYEALTPALYGIGSHTITLTSAAGMTGVGYLDVHLVTGR